MKLDRTLIDSDHAPTPEEMRAYAIRNDITASPLPLETNKATDGQNRLYKQAQKYFFDKYAVALRENGVTARLKNLSSQNPLRALEERDAQMIAGATVNILSDPEECERDIEMFFEVMRPQLELAFQTYATSRGREVDDLTEDEIRKIVDGVADLFVETMIGLLQQAQGTPEMAKILKGNGAHEDFNPDVFENHDKIDFLRHWDHLRSIVGEILSLEGLTEKYGEDHPMLIASEDSGESVTKEELDAYVEGFMKTLPDSIDREIIRLRYEKDATQAEIAECLGFKSQSAVTKRMAKLKDKLKNFMSSK